MKDVEVGHLQSDAVELFHQRRLDVVEELGAHKAWRVGRFASQSISKKLSAVTFSVYTRGSPKPVLQTEKPTDNKP